MFRPRHLGLLLSLLGLPRLGLAQDLGRPRPESPAETAPSQPVAPPEPAPAAPTGGEPPPAPAGAPPGTLYVEPGGESPAATEERAEGAGTPSIPEEPSAVAEPPVPVGPGQSEPPPHHRAPKTAFWAGARLGWFDPFGTLWHDGFLLAGACCVYERRGWSDYASSGPMFEVDVGARLARNYNVFALWERASLGSGDLDPDAFGGQERGTTDYWAAAGRFSTNPDSIGFLIELALGYRMFTAEWKDGTELHLDGGFFDARIGIGADIRLWAHFSLTPLVTIASGTFTEADWSGPRESGPANSRFDTRGQYGSLTLQLGGHFDIY